MQKLNMKIKNKRFHLRLASTIGMHNISESPKIIELARELGINDVMFGAIDLGDKSKLHLSMNPRKAVHFFQQAKDLADKYKIRFSCPKRIGGREIKNNNNWDDFSLQIDKYFSFQLEESNPLNGKCGYPWIQTAIRANGDVISCCQREHILGSMKKNSFFKIWNNKNYQRLRSQKIFYNCLGKKCNMAVYSIWK
jgi:MoaA/NifB/PqqE/SkfB family radical SAM enzyme